MSGGLSRFLGDTPLRVGVRLLVFSFIVGLVMSALDIRPWQIWLWARQLVERIYNMGFAFFADALEYLIAGAMIVVPLFIIMRLLRLGGRARRMD